MKRPKLTKRWIRWQKARFQSLTAEGMPTHLAYLMSQSEASARRNMGRVIGHVAAEQARLLCTSDGEDLRFYLIGDFDTLSETQADRLNSAAGVQISVLV